MQLTADVALDACARLLGVACALQSLEMLSIREAYSERGVWPWSVLRAAARLPAGAAQVADALLGARGFAWVQGVRLLVSGGLVAFGCCPLVVVVWLSTLLTCLRWRG